MTLTLKIENYDRLDDGGPAQITVDSQGLSVGRSPNSDWTLPDPARHVSSQHFTISFTDGTYWLTDTSTNGTFLIGQPYRLDGAHRLAEGDRFQVGHYIIAVSLGAGASAAAAPDPFQQPAPGNFAAEADPWSVGGSNFDPIDPNPAPPAHQFDDFADEFIATPGFAPAPPPAAPVQRPAPQAPAAAPVVPQPVAPAAAPPASDSPFGAPGMPQAAPPLAAPATSPAQAAPAPVAPGGQLAAAFREGAGLPPAPPGSIDEAALARELGRTMRVMAEELMTLLRDRASAKQFTRAGERTMMGATANNPLKFMPSADQALDVMLFTPRDGFQHSAEATQAALADVRMHQSAVFAAIQPALARLLEDLAPEAIEESAGSGLLGAGRKGKAWDTFVQRWDAKAAAHENGMLDVFLAYFAESYAQAVASGKKPG
ncbi:type VI secretion system-associated FHA domain protein TagH [Aestuariibius sp. 2305UL40-4]|uniref:type VI secretion system-associated FHA domain protein TagH n=1 Tax=Aestuariibius violaceus TaxID=3234132 RepID=UPI00398E654F